MKLTLLILLTLPLPSTVFAQTPSTVKSPTPLARAHSHNDYEHDRPLLDALDHGFCSVEADIYLVDGQLLVAHDRNKVQPSRTLQSLYLDPLRHRAQKFNGRIYPNGPPLILLIDIKSDANDTYRTLEMVLQQYADLLTPFPGHTTNAVLAILSGNRPRDRVAAQKKRFVAIDGRLPDLQSNPPTDLIPLISDDWKRHFSWRGTGPLPDHEKQKLRSLVQSAHQQGRKIRFWGAPDLPDAWNEFHDAGVDLINTDNLSGLQSFLSSSP